MRKAASQAPAARLILLDRDQDRMHALRARLGRFEHDGATAELYSDLDDLLAHNALGSAQAILCDLETLGTEADLVEQGVARLSKAAPGSLIVALNADAPVTLTLTALYAGAHEVLSRSIGAADLARRIEELAFRHTTGSAEASHRTLRPSADLRQWVGISAEAERIAARIERIARSTAPVFVTGPQGVGKSFAAQLIHEQSARGRGKLAWHDFAEARHHADSTDAADALSQALLSTNGGTLVLKHAPLMPAGAQARLLRYLQTGRALDVKKGVECALDVRLIATAIAQIPADGAALREDLYHRLTVLPLAIAPLTERREDIVPLARHMLANAKVEMGSGLLRFSARAEKHLMECQLPGNARQLHAAITRLACAEGVEVVSERMLLTALENSERDDTRHARATAGEGTVQILPMWMEEQRVIERALQVCDGNIAKAAAALEISPSTIYRKKQYWAAHGQSPNAA